jgi:hypothetical protein
MKGKMTEEPHTKSSFIPAHTVCRLMRGAVDATDLQSNFTEKCL